MPRYTIDTNILISQRRSYPRDIFKGLWEPIEAMFQKKDIVVSIMVMKELERIDDDILKYAQKWKEIFVYPTEDQQVICQDIVNQNPNWIKPNGKNSSDPFVIALASAKSLTVVTDEFRKQTNIPKVCQGLNVPCTNFFGFLRAEKIIWEGNSVLEKK